MSLDTPSFSTNHQSGPVSNRIQNQPELQPQQPVPVRSTQPQSRACRFFNTSKGCRAGSQCPFQHIRPKEPPSRNYPQEQAESSSSVASGHPSLVYRSRGSLTRGAPSEKPTSKLQQNDPREFQILQVVKRFSPLRNENPDATTLSFSLAPSDPDFPFDLKGGLRCDLTISAGYPQNGRPTLRITNADMARGFQINVEKGFDSLVAASPQKSLLALLNDLDKNLETFLTAEKAQTIKIVANAEKTPNASGLVQEPVKLLSPPSIPIVPILPSWSPQQKADAVTKRQTDVRQLEARMGRVSGFSKSSDGTNFNVPVQISKPGRLPVKLQRLKDITLLVPKLYNLETCTVLLNGVGGSEVENVQSAFERHVEKNQDMSLMAHVNYLTQNIYTMATEISQDIQATDADLEILPPDLTQSNIATTASEETDTNKDVVDKERPHIHFIPRPPEWDRHDSDGGTDESSYDSEEYTDTDGGEGEDEAEQGGASLPSTASASVEKGIHISFPDLELHNIELLILDSLSLSVKCLRCKTPSDVSKIKGGSDLGGTVASTTRNESCPKCTTSFTFSYVSNALHANTVRAGTIEVTGCTITDMLPSTFQPTCSSCSTTFPVPPGMMSVRGDTPIQVCRSCHAKMTFTIHEVKFLRVSHAAGTLPLRRPKKENLGISAGTPLPNNGTCSHYRHSYRWFRFSCCNRVHACDRCHDAAEEHVNERAERMVCGWCSREQRFRSEDCGVCGRSVMRQKKRGGFWEGGQGTRDRRLMSRNEKRKYKRPSAKEAASIQGKKH